RVLLPGVRMFSLLSRLSAAGIPTIELVFGNTTAGVAYVPWMSDHVVMIKERSKVFLAGPPLVKTATGEESDDESLGGAEMHARISGLDRKSTRLNSSHLVISYAVFCLKKKNKN